MITLESIETRWVIGAVIMTLAILGFIMTAFAQFSDVYGDVTGSVYGDVYMTPPSRGLSQSPILVPPVDATSPSVTIAPNGQTYGWPGQEGGPAVIVPPTSGETYVYEGMHGLPDVTVLPNGQVITTYPGR